MLNTIIPLEAASPEHSSSSNVLRLDVEGKLPLTVQSFIGQRIAMLGTSGMGKTNTLALILEKTLPFMPTVIFDQHDEFWGLCERYEILRVGKSPESQIKAGVEQAAQIAEISHSKRLSVLVEMLNMTRQERQDFVEAYCARIWELNKRAKLPYGIVLEEAQNFIPEGKSTPAQDMMKQFALEGRKFGFTIFISTQRSAEVSKTVLGQCGLAFLHGVDIYADVQAYAGMLPYTAAETKKIALHLGVGECIVKVKQGGRAEFIHPVKMLRRQTFHVGDTPTLDQDAPPPLRAIDADLLKELQALLKPIKTSPPSPLATRGEGEQYGAAHDAHIDSYIADLRAKLEAANREIASWTPVRLVPTNGQPSAGLIAHALADRGTIGRAPAPADVQVKSTPEVSEWDGRSGLATQRAKNKQQRDFEGLVKTIQDQKVVHRRILVYLAQREGQAFSEKELARNLGYALHTIQHGGYPNGLINRKLIRRGLTANRREYTFESTVREKLLEMCPDLDIEPMVERIKKLERL
jgi:hypothetical protein